MSGVRFIQSGDIFLLDRLQQGLSWVREDVVSILDYDIVTDKFFHVNIAYDPTHPPGFFLKRVEI